MSPRAEMEPEERRFVEIARVARLATADAQGRPHVVPVCYAISRAKLVIALDEKPKRVEVMQLRRVRNLTERPEADLVVDRYSEDWGLLGFVRIHCAARLVEPGATGHSDAVAALRARYAQYLAMELEKRPIIELTPTQVASWGSLDLLATAASEPQSEGRGTPFLAPARGPRSVWQFTDQPVEREVLERLLDAVGWAPSPHGRQPWRFAVLTRPALKDALAEAMGAEWQRTLAMDGVSPEVVAARVSRSRQRVGGAPALIVACLNASELDVYPDAGRQAAETAMAVQSLGAAVQNILLAAYTAGLDSGLMWAPLFCPDVVRETLELDPNLIPHALISVGYAKAILNHRAHRPIQELMVRLD